MKRVNIELWDLLGCFHYILNAPRTRMFTCIIKTFCKVENCLKMSNYRHKSIKIKYKAKIE